MDGNRLKPFNATQRVRHPPGKGGARQPEASLAWAPATALVKRRQRALKPCISPEIMYRGSPCRVGFRGSTCKAAMARRVGSTGVSAQGRGAGGVARQPERSRRHPHETAGTGAPAEQRSRPACRLGDCRSAPARTRNAKAMRNPRAKQ